MSFRINFEPSVSFENTPIHVGQEIRSTKKARKRKQVNFTPTELETPPAAKKLLMEQRTLRFGNGRNYVLYNGLKTNKAIRRRRITNNHMDQELYSTITKALIILNSMINDNHLQWLEWNAVNNIITAVLPEKTANDANVLTHKAWKKYKTNLSKVSRQTSLFRLAEALQVMGNEFMDLADISDTVIRKIFKRLTGANLSTSIEEFTDWRESLFNCPKKIEKNGFRFQYQSITEET